MNVHFRVSKVLTSHPSDIHVFIWPSWWADLASDPNAAIWLRWGRIWPGRQCRVHRHECFETRSQGWSSTHCWWDMGRPSWVLHRACTSITSCLLLTFCSHSYRLIYSCTCMLVSFSVVRARSWLFSLVSQLYTLGHIFWTRSQWFGPGFSFFAEPDRTGLRQHYHLLTWACTHLFFLVRVYHFSYTFVLVHMRSFLLVHVRLHWCVFRSCHFIHSHRCVCTGLFFIVRVHSRPHAFILACPRSLSPVFSTILMFPTHVLE